MGTDNIKITLNHSLLAILLINLTFLLLTVQVSAQKQEDSNEEQGSRSISKPASPQSAGDKIEFKNQNGNAVITITDEGSDNGSISLPKMSSAPSNLSNKLYNLGGDLHFEGVAVGSGGAGEIDDLSDARVLGNSIFLGSGSGINDDGSDNKNYGLGINSLGSNTSGYANAAMGFNAMFFNTEGIQNVGLGQGSLYSNTTGNNNVAVGYHSNHFNQTGSNNTMLGYQAGRGASAHSKSGNIFIGYQAGYNETGNNKLYIDNSPTASPLIWGDFNNDDIQINGDFHVTGNITADGAVPTDNDWDDGIDAGAMVLYNPSLRVGIGTNGATLEPKLHVKGDEGVLFQGTNNNGTSLSLGTGTRFHFYPKKSALRGGIAVGSDWDDANIGVYSTAFGYTALASGTGSFAAGYETESTGNYSFSGGYRSKSNYIYSTAFGYQSSANSTYTFAVGDRAEANGQASVSLGALTDANGGFSAAFGSNTIANARYSFALGRLNVGNGDPNQWIETDPIFEIGIGTDSGNRKNAFTVLKNSKVGIGTHDPSFNLEIHENSSGVSQMSIQNDDTGINGLRIGINANEQAFVSNDQNQDMFFSTNATERMRITNDGKVGIGRDPSTFNFEVQGDAGKTSGGTTWNVISDIRMKDIHGNYDKGLKEINMLRTVKFSYKPDNSLSLPHDTQELGFIAQEVQKIFPEAISRHKSGYLDFNMHPVNVAMVNAVKELSNKNDELKRKISELENQNSKLERIIIEVENKISKIQFVSK